MKNSKCYTCERMSSNLLRSNCGHKICFGCVKNNRNSHKCSVCSMSKSRSHANVAYSPVRKTPFSKQHERQSSGAKTKSFERYTQKFNEQSSPYSRTKSSRKNLLSRFQNNSHQQSYRNELYAHEQQQENAASNAAIGLICKDHHEPLTMFSKSAKQAICSVCLCSKSKYKDEIMPIRGAEEFLKRQNHNQRQESRLMLSDVENCQKTIEANQLQFQKYYESNMESIQQIFHSIHKQLQEKQQIISAEVKQLFDEKIERLNSINTDLSYLVSTLKEYREQNNPTTNTLTQSLYVYSSFKVIRKTIGQLNLDYIDYANRENLFLFKYQKESMQSLLESFLTFSDHLPLKEEEKKQHRKRSASSRTTTHHGGSKSKNQSVSDTIMMGEHQNWTRHKESILKNESHRKSPYKANLLRNNNPRHQTSLCSNGSELQMTEDQRNLYKRLLKSRFKC